MKLDDNIEPDIDGGETSEAVMDGDEDGIGSDERWGSNRGACTGEVPVICETSVSERALLPL